MPYRTGSLQLLHPAFDRIPSGGNVYNRNLLQAAERHGFALESVVVETAEVGRRFQEACRHFRIWDGLLLEEIDRLDVPARRDWGLLLHYLPSQDPAVAPARRRHLQSMETAAVGTAALVVVSGAGLQAVLAQRHPRRRFAVCEPGVSPAFLVRRDHHPVLVRATVEMLTVANLLPAKGLLDLLAPLAALRSIPWRWHIVGERGIDAGHAAQFEATAARLGLAPRIHLHGVLDPPGVAARMDRADLFVFPSRFESYGMALAEAAARALPVVSTRVGAAERLFRHGSNALLSPVGDLRGFATNLRRLMEDGPLRRRFRENLRAHRPRTWDDALVDFVAATRSLPPASSA